MEIDRKKMRNNILNDVYLIYVKKCEYVKFEKYHQYSLFRIKYKFF